MADMLTATPVRVDRSVDAVWKEYVELSSAMGLDQTQLQKHAVTAALSHHGVCVYDEAAVTKYLNRVYGWQWPGCRPTWCWRALRFTDRYDFTAVSRPRRNGLIITKTSYRFPVPMPVLLKVRDLASGLRDFRPCFFVSDAYHVSDEVPPDLDPFLLMVCGRVEDDATFRGVVERWDEPAFRVE